MIIETKEIYKCEYCRKLYQMKHFCISHESTCMKNPVNFRACIGCNNLKKKIVDVNFSDYNGNDSFEKRELLYCEKIDQFLYPPKVEFKGNAFEGASIDDGTGEEKENNPMRVDCEFQNV